MKVAVLGGLGIQGKAVLTDLSNSKILDEVICADTNLYLWENISCQIDVKNSIR
jgi:saccharopine dehydrogenase-like NADP-dependent oxidoreductase